MKRLGKYRILLIAVVIFMIALVVMGSLLNRDGARECMISHMLDNKASSLEYIDAYYISIGSPGSNEKDPSIFLINRFSNHVPPVKSVSQCTSKISGVIDKATGKRGAVIYIKSMKWKTPFNVVVSAGYFEGGLSGWGGTFLLVHRLGGWTVVNTYQIWES
ncbi:MAG: hypothetical protein ACYC0V_03715 [Armatimonadota bacterium]